jgi:hypothetical protein
MRSLSPEMLACALKNTNQVLELQIIPLIFSLKLLSGKKRGVVHIVFKNKNH